MRIVCDIDGTLLYTRIDNGIYTVYDKAFALIESINRHYDNGDEIILHTGRHWNHLQLTIEQLKTAGVKYTTLVMGKPVGDYYIDDRSVRPYEFL
jgi:hydroxymethylpyrimidine pyrophosphatase-like HAD family hydrolase